MKCIQISLNPNIRNLVTSLDNLQALRRTLRPLRCWLATLRTWCSLSSKLWPRLRLPPSRSGLRRASNWSGSGNSPGTNTEHWTADLHKASAFKASSNITIYSSPLIFLEKFTNCTFLNLVSFASEAIHVLVTAFDCYLQGVQECLIFSSILWIWFFSFLGHPSLCKTVANN